LTRCESTDSFLLWVSLLGLTFGFVLFRHYGKDVCDTGIICEVLMTALKVPFRVVSVTLLAAGVVACSPQQTAEAPVSSASSGDVVTELTAADIPEGARAAVLAAVPGMTIKEAQRKARENRVYFDIEGSRPDGSEVELDVLEKDGRFEVVEIQRDIAWGDAPASVKTAAEGSGKSVTPVRVIESAQPDGTIIYELFADGKPAKPSLEVRLKNGKADVLTEEWPH
jgi:hypothetical protein